MPIFLTISFLFLIIAGLILFFIRRKKLNKTSALKLFLINLPQGEINFSSQLFGILTALKSPFGLEAAVHDIGEEIHFYAAMPEESVEFARGQIGNLSKEIKLEPTEDYNIFNPQGVSAGVYLKRKLFYALPARKPILIKNFKFAPILGGLSKINEVGEGAVVQLLIKPISQSFKKSILKTINNFRKGAKLNVDGKATKILESRINKPLFSVNLRVLASAPSQYQADAILENIIAGFSQFCVPFRDEIKIVRPRNPQNLIRQFSFRETDENQSMVLNKEELSALFNLPDSPIN